MSTSRRDRILNRGRAALGPERSAELPPPVVTRRDDLATREARIDCFTATLERVGGRVHRVAGPDEAAGALREIVTRHGVESLVHSDAPELVPLVESLPATVERGAEPGDRDTLLSAHAGLTGAQAAIAETGTLVLDSTAERHRLVSLLPPLHVAVLDAGAIVATIGEALARFGNPPPAALTFITGPSRTADIELELVVGVHGPKALEVILV